MLAGLFSDRTETLQKYSWVIRQMYLKCKHHTPRQKRPAGGYSIESHRRAVTIAAQQQLTLYRFHYARSDGPETEQMRGQKLNAGWHNST